VLLASRMTHDIKRSTERYLELLEALPDPTIMLDKLGRISSINRATEELSGYRRDELVGKFFPKAGIVVPSSLPVALRNFAVSLSGRTHAPYEIDVKLKDGSIRTFEVNSRPVVEAAQTTGVQVVLRDVTKRKEIMSQLARQSAELQRINRFMIGRELKMTELKRQLAARDRTPNGKQ
jgi:PAS domain S-box-containing protein